MTLQKSLQINALIGERLYRISKEERQQIVKDLLKTRSQQQLADEIGIPKSTIQDWSSLRQSNKGGNIHLSLSSIIKKLNGIDTSTFTDWGRIEYIKEKCEELLRAKTTSSRSRSLRELQTEKK